MLVLTLSLVLAAVVAPVTSPVTASKGSAGGEGSEASRPVERPRLLVLHLEPANISPEEGRAIDALVLAGARSDDVIVMSQTELQQLAALDAAAQGAGCDTSSCLAEMAGALGARYVLFGTSSRLGSTSTVSVAVFDAASGDTVRDTVTVENLDVLSQRVPPRVRGLIAQAMNPTASLPAAEVAPWTPLAVTGVAVAGLGGAVAVAGLGVAAWSEFLIVRDAAALAADKRSAQQRGIAGLGAAGIGIVVAAVGAGVFVLGGAE